MKEYLGEKRDRRKKVVQRSMSGLFSPGRKRGCCSTEEVSKALLPRARVVGEASLSEVAARSVAERVESSEEREGLGEGGRRRELESFLPRTDPTLFSLEPRENLLRNGLTKVS